MITMSHSNYMTDDGKGKVQIHLSTWCQTMEEGRKIKVQIHLWTSRKRYWWAPMLNVAMKSPLWHRAGGRMTLSPSFWKVNFRQSVTCHTLVQIGIYWCYCHRQIQALKRVILWMPFSDCKTVRRNGHYSHPPLNDTPPPFDTLLTS